MFIGTADPCGDGAGVTLPGDGGSVAYQPEGGSTDDNLDCTWHMTCSGSNNVVILTFTEFDTENSYDFIDLYDGDFAGSGSGSGDTPPFAHLSGAQEDLARLSYESHSPEMTVHFTTDRSIGRGGFAAEYSCQAPTDGGDCVDHIEELAGPGACAQYFDAGYTCESNFCETCNFSGQCDLSCRICGGGIGR